MAAAFFFVVVVFFGFDKLDLCHKAVVVHWRKDVARPEKRKNEKLETSFNDRLSGDFKGRPTVRSNVT
jgi:hypothetical protein